MDALSDVLGMLRFESSVYFLKEFPAPWGMAVPEGPFAQFHLVCRGTCWLGSGVHPTPVRLSAGDVVVFPRGTEHWLADHPRSRKIEGARIIADHAAGKQTFAKGSPDATLICGHFSFNRDVPHPLLRSLPRVMRVNVGAHPALTWFEPALLSALRQDHGAAPGSTALALRLAEALFLQVLRVTIEEAPARPTFLTALADPVVGSALDLLHQTPEAGWDLATLARRTATSRSVLAARFKHLVGVSPMRYLAEWRVVKARELLLGSALPLGEIGRRVGYTSEPAFHRAFKRIARSSPGQVRRRAARGG